MLNLWEKSKVVLYFEDADGEGFVGQTVNDIIKDPADEDVEKLANAINSLSDLQLGHLILTQNQRYVI